MAIKFHQRHYEEVADVLAELQRQIRWTDVELATDLFIATFKRDNPRFDAHKFLKRVWKGTDYLKA